jgi:tetratricopeptide (TPR) repeat protein
MNPKNEVMAYNVAEICFKSNNTDGAIEYYKKAIEIKPKWSLPYLKLGYAYLNKGDIKKSKEVLKKFIEIDPKNPQVATVKSILDSL